jgi:Tfp pilus assembly protein PilO
MIAVRDLKKQARVLVILLAVVDVAAAAILLSPVAGFRSTKLREDEQVRKQWQDEMHKAIPVRDIDKKIQEARVQVADFYQARFPDRTSALAIELGKLSKENNVKLSNVAYKADDETVEGLRRLQMDASLSGDYVKVVKFINALERDQMFLLVDSVVLGEQQGGAVTLHLRLETYLRQGETVTANETGHGK